MTTLNSRLELRSVRRTQFTRRTQALSQAYGTCHMRPLRHPVTAGRDQFETIAAIEDRIYRMVVLRFIDDAKGIEIGKGRLHVFELFAPHLLKTDNIRSTGIDDLRTEIFAMHPTVVAVGRVIVTDVTGHYSHKKSLWGRKSGRSLFHHPFKAQKIEHQMPWMVVVFLT